MRMGEYLLAYRNRSTTCIFLCSTFPACLSINPNHLSLPFRSMGKMITLLTDRCFTHVTHHNTNYTMNNPFQPLNMFASLDMHLVLCHWTVDMCYCKQYFAKFNCFYSVAALLEKQRQKTLIEMFESQICSNRIKILTDGKTKQKNIFLEGLTIPGVSMSKTDNHSHPHANNFV